MNATSRRGLHATRRTLIAAGALAGVLATGCDAADRTTAVTQSRQRARIDTLSIVDTSETSTGTPSTVDVPPPIQYQGYTITDISQGGWSVANDINNHDVIVGSYMKSGQLHGFVRYPSGVFEDIPPLPGNVSNEATGISDDGTVVGTSTSQSGVTTGWFQLPQHSPWPMNGLCFGGTTTTAIDDLGEIVGACNGGPAYWSYYGATTLTPRTTGEFSDVSAGRAVGWDRGGINHARRAFEQDAHGWFTVGLPLSTSSSWFTGVNASGQMVGVYNLAGLEHGFLATVTSVRLLSHAALGISGKGRVVGEYAGLPSVGYTIAPNGSFETALPPLTVDRSAVRVNRCGSIVGQYFPLGLPAGPRAALWTKPQCD